MKARVLTLHLDPETGGFDDSPLVDLLADTDALQITDHLFTHEGVPTLVLVVRYRSLPRPAAAGSGRVGGRRLERAPDPAADLGETDRALFETLRRWRNNRARSDGRPAYVLFTNAQLAAISTDRPATLAALQAIEGIGEGRARDYGADVLAIVQAVPAGATTEEPGDDDADPANRPG